MKRKGKLRYLIAEKPSKLKQIKNKREALVRLRQGALSRPGQEHRAGADSVYAVEPVAEANAVDACRGEGVPVMEQTLQNCAESVEKPKA